MKQSILHADKLMQVTGVLTTFVAGVSILAPRYRRHQVIGITFFAAPVLFLPIFVVAGVSIICPPSPPPTIQRAARDRTMGSHITLVLIWTGLVLNV